MYGATEAAARLTFVPPADLGRKRGSIGRAIPDVDVRVLTDEGAVAAPGVVGELVARGANIASGYWNRPDETAERFGPEGYRTGDLGYVDDEGFLFLAGRRHDMIKVGANRVGAREIEDVLHQHPRGPRGGRRRGAGRSPRRGAGGVCRLDERRSSTSTTRCARSARRVWRPTKCRSG